MQGPHSLSNRIRVCRIVTIPITFATLLREQIRCIVDAGIDLTLVSSPGAQFDEVCESARARGYPIPIAREPAPVRDLMSLAALTNLFRREHFDIVHSSTPKAGLLTALAGAVVRSPIRMHTFTGQAWMELHRPLRGIVRFFDSVIGHLDTDLYADSHSQRDFLIAEGLVDPDKIHVLGRGSISGVDLRRYDQEHLIGSRTTQRQQLGIAENALVIVFVGRVNKDKGIVELVDAFRLIQREYQNLHLLLAGPFEPEHDPLPVQTLTQISTSPFIHAVGFTPNPEEYLAAADIFCLPSYREGFGSVAIEAGASRLPSVVTRVTGLVDAVVEGETGLFVQPKDVESLVRALRKLIESPDLREQMGRAAHERVNKYFDATLINQLMANEYLDLAKRN
jgi:glycosyltransferase involved in cell wall biosynthesis